MMLNAAFALFTLALGIVSALHLYERDYLAGFLIAIGAVFIGFVGKALAIAASSRKPPMMVNNFSPDSVKASGDLKIHREDS